MKNVAYIIVHIYFFWVSSTKIMAVSCGSYTINKDALLLGRKLLLVGTCDSNRGSSSADNIKSQWALLLWCRGPRYSFEASSWGGWDLISPIWLRVSMGSCSDRNPGRKRSGLCRGSADTLSSCLNAAGYWGFKSVLSWAVAVGIVCVIWCFSYSCKKSSIS